MDAVDERIAKALECIRAERNDAEGRWVGAEARVKALAGDLAAAEKHIQIKAKQVDELAAKLTVQHGLLEEAWRMLCEAGRDVLNMKDRSLASLLYVRLAERIHAVIAPGQSYSTGVDGGTPEILPPREVPAPHGDDVAAMGFVDAMRAKLAVKRAQGYGGWQGCSVEYLQDLLAENVAKGDPVDVANFAMMLWAREAKTARTATTTPEAMTSDIPGDHAAILAAELQATRDRLEAALERGMDLANGLSASNPEAVEFRKFFAASHPPIVAARESGFDTLLRVEAGIKDELIKRLRKQLTDSIRQHGLALDTLREVRDLHHKAVCWLEAVALKLPPGQLQRAVLAWIKNDSDGPQDCAAAVAADPGNMSLCDACQLAADIAFLKAPTFVKAPVIVAGGCTVRVGREFCNVLGRPVEGGYRCSDHDKAKAPGPMVDDGDETFECVFRCDWKLYRPEFKGTKVELPGMMADVGDEFLIRRTPDHVDIYIRRGGKR